MRVPEVILVRVWVLEHFVAHIALNFIVRGVYILHMPRKLGSTDILVTIAAVLFACNKRIHLWYIP